MAKIKVKKIKHSSVTKLKISLALRDRPHPWAQGVKLSPEHRAKISAALKGRPRPYVSIVMSGRVVSDQTRAKLSAMRRGVPNGRLACKHSAESRARMSASSARRNKPGTMLGRKQTAEARAKMSAAASLRKGSLNPAWLGGMSKEPYEWDFNDELKEEVRRRDGYKCQFCGTPQQECKRTLSVHHVDYNKKNSDPVNLISLCPSCHARTCANREHWKKLFQALLIKKGALLVQEQGGH